MRLSQPCLLLLFLFGCGEAETIAEARVRLMTQSSVGDGSFGELSAAGATLASAGVGANFALDLRSNLIDTDEARAVFRDWVAEASERELFVLSGVGYEQIVREANCDFGGASVLLIGEESDTCTNLRTVTYQAFEPAYLAGVAAVSDPNIAPSGRVGVIAGVDLPEIQAIIEPFVAGVESRGGTVDEIVFIGTEASAFVDSARARALAETMAPRVDVMLVFAGPAGVGVGQALEQLETSERTYLIGVETDYSLRFAEVTLGSILYRYDYAIRDAILEFIGGRLSSGNVEVGFRDRNTELVLSPTYGWRAIGGGCAECDRYDIACLSDCDTLIQVVERATEEAREARAAR